jgi:hypothetical protein
LLLSLDLLSRTGFISRFAPLAIVRNDLHE